MSNVPISTYGIHEEDAKAIFVQTLIQEASHLDADETMADDFKGDIRDTMGWDEERTEAVYDQIVDDSRAIYNSFGTDRCYKKQVDETRRVMDVALTALEKRVDNLGDFISRERMEAAKEKAVEKTLADLKDSLFKK